MPLRVYLVEDSPILSRFLRESIQAAGADVVGHSDGAARAITEINALRPDAVIIDIALRDGTGFEVVKSLRKSFGAKGPVAMILTNYVLDPYREAAKKLGVKYFFDKGNQIPEMLRVLQALPRLADKANGGGRG